MEICLVWKCNHTNNLTAGKQMILLQTPPTSTLKQVFIDYSEKASESGLDSRVYFTHCPSLCVVSVMTDGHVWQSEVRSLSSILDVTESAV